MVSELNNLIKCFYNNYVVFNAKGDNCHNMWNEIKYKSRYASGMIKWIVKLDTKEKNKIISITIMKRGNEVDIRV